VQGPSCRCGMRLKRQLQAPAGCCNATCLGTPMVALLSSTHERKSALRVPVVQASGTRLGAWLGMRRQKKAGGLGACGGLAATGGAAQKEALETSEGTLYAETEEQ
jgi:hypothetical protein